MTETIVLVLVWLLVVVVVAWVAHYIVTHFFPAELHRPVLLIAGILLLLLLIGAFYGGWPFRRIA